MPSDYMYTMKCSDYENFEQGKLSPYGNIEMSPSAGVLNYGQARYNLCSHVIIILSKLRTIQCKNLFLQLSLYFSSLIFRVNEVDHINVYINLEQGLFEGIKAYRRENGGLFLFRPEQNAMRMQIGADRMCMPAPSVEQFVDAVKHTALANRRWVI